MDRRESSTAVSTPLTAAHASTCPCPPAGASVARALGTASPARATCCR